MFDVIKAQLAHAVPFVRTCEIDLLEVSEGRGVAKLKDLPQLKNHIGTVHAAAIFLVGETASGAATAGGFAGQILEIRPVARAANINYLKPAKTALVASARIDADLGALRSQLEREGKAVFDVDVEIADESGETIATMRVGWQVSRRSR